MPATGGDPSRRAVVCAALAGSAGLLAAARPAAAATPATTLGVIDVHDFAGGSGVVDRAAVRAAVAAAAGGGTVYFRPGRYDLHVAPGAPGAPPGPPRIADLPSGVELWFDHAEVRVAGSPAGDHCAFLAVGATDLTVRGARVVGTGQASGRGFAFVGCERVEVLDSAVSRFAFAGVEVLAGPWSRPSADVRLDGCHLTGCGGAGLRLAGTSEVVVGATTVGRLGDPVRPFTGVLVDGRSAANVGVTVMASHVEANHVGIAAIGEGNAELAVVASTLAENGVGFHGAATDLQLTANSIHRNGGEAVAVVGGDRPVIGSNAVSHCGGGIRISAGGATVIGNVIYNCGSGLDAPADALVSANVVNGVLG